mgnify:CR=1 FL=1
MKKLLIVFLVMAYSVNMDAQSIHEYGAPVMLSVHVFHPTQAGINFPKSPVQPPEVYLDGYTLYIVSSHADYTLVVEDTDETEVYQTSVPSSVSTVVLPSSLSGTYILKLETDTFIFEGEIEL